MVNKITSGGVMTTSAALRHLLWSLLMKGNTSCVKIPHFQVKRGINEACKATRSGNDLKGENEGLQECLSTSCHGELNETYCSEKKQKSHSGRNKIQLRESN